MKNANQDCPDLETICEVAVSFALSGTPIENHLVSYGLFSKSSCQDFCKAERIYEITSRASWLSLSNSWWAQERRSARLNCRLNRSGLQNELEGPAKGYLPSQLQQMQDRLSSGFQIRNFQRSRVEVLSGLMRLRQICDTLPLYGRLSGAVASWIVSDCWYRWQTADTVSCFSQFKGNVERSEQNCQT